MSTKYRKRGQKGMQIVRQKSRLKNEPIVLTLITQGEEIPLHINKRFLTVCKKSIAPGQSAELYKDQHFLLTYTRLANDARIFHLQQHYGDQTFDLRTLTLCGELFQIDNHDKSVQVSGLENIAKNMVFREFHIPSLTFNTPCVLPAIGAREQAYAAIRSMNLVVSAKDLKENSVIKHLAKEGVVACQVANRRNVSMASTVPRNLDQGDCTPSTMLNLDTAQRMLWFNNNAVSRLRSLYHHLPIDFARSACLNVAIGHASTHPSSSILISHTFQHVPVSKELIQALQDSVSDVKPSSKIQYLDRKGSKLKVSLFKASDKCQNLLRAHKLNVRRGDAFMSIALDGTPILTADIDMGVLPTYDADFETKPDTESKYNKQESIKNDLRRRMNLHAICVYHHTMQPALHILVRAATSCPHFFPPVSSPGLDIWASKQAIAYD